MRLSLIFELLLIFVLLAFAASAAVVSPAPRASNNKRLKPTRGKVGDKKRQQDSNKYCSCSTKLCNCCREFNIPVVALQGPGCASLQYLKGDRLAISMSFGERVLTNTTISSRKPKPVCMPLPGGVSKFCGRVYNIGRKGTDFNACLGLELRSLDEIEAAVRVSCFRFGPQGLRVEPPRPLPAVEEDDEDDDEEEDEYDEDDDDNDVDSEDYSTFSVFGDDIIDSLFAGEVDADTSDEKPAKKPTTTKPPARKATRKPTRSTTVAPKTQKPTRRKATTKPTTTVTTEKTVMEDTLPSSAPHESIAAVTAMLQASPAMPAPIEVVMSSSPANDMMEPLKNSTEMSETTTVVSTEKAQEEAKPTGSYIIKKGEEDDDDDEDPLADAIEEELEDDSKETVKTTDESKVNGTSDGNKKKQEESEEVVDEIIDGVVDTFAGGESEKKNGTSGTTQASNEDEDDDDDDDDDEDDEDDDDEESRKARRRLHRRFSSGRQSRDMWLERLHW